MVSDIDETGGKETVSLITANGGEAAFMRADVARSADVSGLISQTVAKFGRLDCACNNAGIEGTIAPFADQTEDNFDRTIAINLKGTFMCLKAESRKC